MLCPHSIRLYLFSIVLELSAAEEFLVQELRHDQSNKSHWHAQNSKPEIRLWISLKHLTFDAGFITMVDSIFPRLLNVSFVYNSNFFHSKTNKITNSAILGQFCFALGSSNLWRGSFNLRIKKSRELILKFVFSKKATKIVEIFTVNFTLTT